MKLSFLSIFSVLIFLVKGTCSEFIGNVEFSSKLPNLINVPPQIPPPTWNPWNEFGDLCHQTNTLRMTCNQSALKLDHHFSILVWNVWATGDFYLQRCLTLQPNQIRWESRSNKDQLRTKHEMIYLEIAPIPRKKRNKFPDAVPWIFLTLNSWHFPRSTAPNRMELEFLVWWNWNSAGRRNGRVPIWRRCIRSVFEILFVIEIMWSII